MGNCSRFPQSEELSLRKWKRTNSGKSAWEMKPYSLQLGAETGRSTVKISVRLSQKSKDRIQYHPPIPLLYTSSAYLRHPCSAMFIATLFTMAKEWNHHPYTDSRIKKPCIYTTKCYVLTRKKIRLCHSRWDGWPGNHHVKGNYQTQTHTSHFSSYAGSSFRPLYDCVFLCVHSHVCVERESWKHKREEEIFRNGGGCHKGNRVCVMWK